VAITSVGTGYEAAFPFLPGDDGMHELRVIFESGDGRRRHFPKLHFEWVP